MPEKISTSTIKKQSRKILWIEDDYYHLKGLIKPLKRNGIQVDVARTFVEAKAMLLNWKEYDLFLCDLIIPFSFNMFEDVKSNSEKIISADDLVIHGTSIIEHLVKEIGIDAPIFILSVVQNESIIKKISRYTNVTYVHKLGLLPYELYDIVMDAIDNHQKTNTN